jgi:hypothetical protein
MTRRGFVGWLVALVAAWAGVPSWSGPASGGRYGASGLESMIGPQDRFNGLTGSTWRQWAWDKTEGPILTAERHPA